MFHSTTPVPPPPKPIVPAKPMQSRAGVLCVTLLLISFLVGATAMTNVTANYLDLAKIVAVVCFIGSMVALALGMVGSSYRS